MNDPDVDSKVSTLLLQVLRKELADDPVGQEIIERFQKEPQSNSQDLTEYLQRRLSDDHAFRQRLAGAKGLTPELRAIVYDGKVERIVQIAQAGTVVINQGFPFWVGITAVIIAVVAVGSLALFLIPRQLPPMAGRFNVAVAQFTVVDETGHHKTTPGSRAFSDWLFQSIKKEIDQLDPALNADSRGPDAIGPISSADQESEAEQVAKRHNANVLIYGEIIYDPVSGYEVVPKFYVSDQDFIYGSEVTGSERLGKPVWVGNSMDAGASFEFNTKLNIRTRVLKFLIRGMAYLLSGDYRRAELDFETAATDPDWGTDEGKEVGYLLLGASRLLAYDPLTNPGVLQEAQQAFETARDLKPTYARSYLGLGEVALLSATRDKADQASRIEQAAQFYLQARAAPERIGYLDEKAEYGLGKANLLGADLGLPGWSQERARQAFETVIAKYANGKEPLLTWQAAQSHGYLGRLAGMEGSWQEMASQCRDAVEILRTLPGKSPRIWAARYWECVGFAETMQGHQPEAVNAYRQAVDIGSQVTASPTEMVRWRATLENLEKGTP